MISATQDQPDEFELHRQKVLYACSLIINRVDQMKKFYELPRIAPYPIINNQLHLINNAVTEINILTATDPERLRKKNNDS